MPCVLLRQTAATILTTRKKKKIKLPSMQGNHGIFQCLMINIFLIPVPTSWVDGHFPKLQLDLTVLSSCL